MQTLLEVKEQNNESKVTCSTDGYELPDNLSQKTINLMNKIAVRLCANDLVSAKELLDEFLELKELKLMTSD